MTQIHEWPPEGGSVRRPGTYAKRFTKIAVSFVFVCIRRAKATKMCKLRSNYPFLFLFYSPVYGRASFHTQSVICVILNKYCGTVLDTELMHGCVECGFIDRYTYTVLVLAIE